VNRRDNRDRIPVDFRPAPLALEREGCRITERPITARMAEIASRLRRVAEAAMPRLDAPQEAWDLILWAGWDAISTERIVSRDRPDDIDTLAWKHMVSAVAEAEEPWAPALAKRMHDMNPVERVAVLERIEAYGRAEAMRSA